MSTLKVDHPRHRNCFLYRGVAVAKGTALYEAIELGDAKKAQELFDKLFKVGNGKA
jgi:hypothetical protein